MDMYIYMYYVIKSYMEYLIVNLGMVDGCAMYMYMYIDMKLGGGRRHIDCGQVKKQLFDECVHQSPWYC